MAYSYEVVPHVVFTGQDSSARKCGFLRAFKSRTLFPLSGVVTNYFHPFPRDWPLHYSLNWKFGSLA